jgi:peptidoglycan hydrolase-like protein with peptidoglycan-binding domain
MTRGDLPEGFEDKPPVALNLEAGLGMDPTAEDDPAPSTEPEEVELAFDRFLEKEGAKTSLQQRDEGEPYWPRDDANAPDYAHLLGVEAESSFQLEAEDIETLIRANRFQPEGFNNVIALAFRGADLASGFEVENEARISLRELRPDHRNFHCVLGFYRRTERRLTLFTGSTVPCPYYIQQYYNRVNGLPYQTAVGCNLLPPACYVFRVARHRDIRPALRATEPRTGNTDATVTVLRTENDLSFGTQDRWDISTPYDNVHCSYFINLSPRYNAFFSSAGCLTVRGRQDPSHQWEKYQAVLNSIGSGRRIDLILLTGRECAIAAKLRQAGLLGDQAVMFRELVRLRVGSTGEEVNRLQRRLGFQGSGYFGASTKERLTAFQRSNNLLIDGIYSPASDQQLGWGVFV